MQREIRLPNEYRTRLIDIVVTDKLDVREAASTLPPLGKSASRSENKNMPKGRQFNII